MSIRTSRTHAVATPTTQSQRIVAAVGAAVLGAFLVYFAGFS